MEIKYDRITLRDCLESDITDEIRWFNRETEWIMADTPWDTIELVDEEKIRKQILYVIATMPLDSIRTRLEIEVEKKHIGFVSYYMLDDEFNFIPFNQVANNAKKYCALGIAICEPSFWSKGLGTQALIAAIKYYQDNGYNDFCLETWSGNIRMLKCAERLGFYVCKREVGVKLVDGINYDALILCLNNEKLNEYLQEA